MSGIEQLDGAKCVVVEKGSGIQNTIIAWFGGVTFNVYSEHNGNFQEMTCFTRYDENGNPLEPEQAEQKIYEWIGNEPQL